MFGSMMGRVEWFTRRKGKVGIQRVVSCYSCSSPPYVTYSIWSFPIFLCLLSWHMTLKAQEGLRGVPQQYNALEVQ